ncbi:MAG: GNAT family N-acetyltransferase [Bacillus sp. (in: firmicutes)]
MKVEIITNEQLEDAFFVRKVVFVEEQKVDVAEEIDQYEDSSTHFVLYDDGRNPVGAGRFREHEGYGKIERICVLAKMRKSGAGKQLMSAIEEYALKEGYQLLKLNAQTQAIPFYEKLGYTVVSEEFMDAGIPHRTMTKPIQ